MHGRRLHIPLGLFLAFRAVAAFAAGDGPALGEPPEAPCVPCAPQLCLPCVSDPCPEGTGDHLTAEAQVPPGSHGAPAGPVLPHPGVEPPCCCPEETLPPPPPPPPVPSGYGEPEAGAEPHGEPDAGAAPDAAADPAPEEPPPQSWPSPERL